jgi:glutamate racemase
MHKHLKELLKSNIYHKKEITVIITDSGLGGISVAAKLYCALKKHGHYEKVRIIFFNALFDASSGYNKLDDFDQKIRLFDTALHGMLKYSPNLILLASNTLSVLYPYTAFSRSPNLPVIGIVEIGVDYILKSVNSNKDAAIILFATPITVNEGTYRKMLIQYLPDTCIIEQACPELAFEIGDGEKEKTQRLIDKYTLQAIQKLHTKNTKIYASLNCTHFGYYQDDFLRAFQQNGLHDVEILNPDSEMVKLLLPKKGGHITCHPDITIEFVSKVKMHKHGMDSLIPFLEPLSKEVVRAFQNYHYNPKLF